MTAIQVGKSVMIGGRQRMDIPSGGAHVRSVEIRLDQLFGKRPAIVATIHSNSPGNTFAIWSVEYNVLGAQTQIVIHATNTEIGKPLNYEFWCEYMVMGVLN